MQAGGQTGLVACASIAPFPFTQLIQQPGAEQSIDPYPSARGAEHRARYASCRSAEMARCHQDTRAEDMLRYSTYTPLSRPHQDSRGFCDESEFVHCRSSPFGCRFLVTIYKPQCQPNVHGGSTLLHPRAGITSRAILKTQSYVVTRPISTTFALLRDDQVACGRFGAGDVPYQTRPAVRSLLDARLVLEPLFD